MKSIVVLLIFLTYSISFALRGNEGSGGGDLLPNTPATQQDIATFIKHAKNYTLAGLTQVIMLPELRKSYHYNGEFQLINEQEVALATDLARRLNNQGLINLVQKFKIEVTNNQPCFDSINSPSQPRDASANLQTFSVCFSPSRVLSKSIPLNQLYHKLTALFVHEISHLIGYNELNAQMFQLILEKMMRGYSLEEVNKSKQRILFYVGYDTPDLIEVIQSDLNRNVSVGQICYRVGQLEQIVMGDEKDIQQSLVQFGFSIFNLNTFKLSKMIRAPIDSLEQICKSEVTNSSKQQINTQLVQLHKLYRALAAEVKKPPFPLSQ